MANEGRDKGIQDALDKVRELIEGIVRDEQLRDGLTGIPNDEALAAAIDGHLEKGSRFWCAFVEIDKFKSINDSFGYQQADSLLQKVAEHLTRASDYFTHGCTAYRPHGDEFYLLGRYEGEDRDVINQRLEMVRAGIGEIRIRVSGKTDPMQCTVSIGWLIHGEDVDLETGEKPTQRGLRLLMEHAVSHAKRKGRNRVVMYTEDVRKSQSFSTRAQCPRCETSFNADVPEEHWKEDELYCPNCGVRITRDPKQVPPPSEQI